MATRSVLLRSRQSAAQLCPPERGSVTRTRPIAGRLDFSTALCWPNCCGSQSRASGSRIIRMPMRGDAIGAAAQVTGRPANSVTGARVWTRSNGNLPTPRFFRLRSGWPNCCAHRAASGSRIIRMPMRGDAIGACCAGDRVAANSATSHGFHRTFSTEQLQPVLPVVCAANRGIRIASP